MKIEGTTFPVVFCASQGSTIFRNPIHNRQDLRLLHERRRCPALSVLQIKSQFHSFATLMLSHGIFAWVRKKGLYWLRGGRPAALATRCNLMQCCPGGSISQKKVRKKDRANLVQVPLLPVQGSPFCQEAGDKAVAQSELLAAGVTL